MSTHLTLIILTGCIVQRNRIKEPDKVHYKYNIIDTYWLNCLSDRIKMSQDKVQYDYNIIDNLLAVLFKIDRIIEHDKYTTNATSLILTGCIVQRDRN